MGSGQSKSTQADPAEAEIMPLAAAETEMPLAAAETVTEMPLAEAPPTSGWEKGAAFEFY
jgi:hypothetical protein